jgi:hypothetical protein
MSPAQYVSVSLATCVGLCRFGEAWAAHRAENLLTYLRARCRWRCVCDCVWHLSFARKSEPMYFTTLVPGLRLYRAYRCRTRSNYNLSTFTPNPKPKRQVQLQALPSTRSALDSDMCLTPPVTCPVAPLHTYTFQNMSLVTGGGRACGFGLAADQARRLQEGRSFRRNVSLLQTWISVDLSLACASHARLR